MPHAPSVWMVNNFAPVLEGPSIILGQHAVFATGPSAR